MTLSTQLRRGSLALPMLVLFASLGLAANKVAPVAPLPAAQAAIVARLCNAPARPVLVLAQAPADLGPIALRLAVPCRA